MFAALFETGGRRIIRVLIIAVACYLAAGTYMYVFQRSFLFLPSGSLARPSERGLDSVQLVEVIAKDGVSLSAWQAKAKGEKPTILYFHGNGGNLSSRSKRFDKIVEAGFGLFALSYRGYAGSGGTPSEQALIADGLIVFDKLSTQTSQIVIYGESLGAAIAVAVAAEREAAAVILESPFSAAVDIARDRYGWLPVEFLMKDPFRSRDRIGKVRSPLLIVHGDADEIIPIIQGRDLFLHAQEPKKMTVFAGARHGDLWDRGMWPAVTEFLDDHLKTER